MTNHMVSDMASRIRNALQVQQPYVNVYNTKITNNIGKILVAEGYIQGMTTNAKFLTLELKYNSKLPPFTTINIMSKPGSRVYSRAINIPKILGGLGVVLVSTSTGVVTDKKARALGIGGELLCTIW